MRVLDVLIAAACFQAPAKYGALFHVQKVHITVENEFKLMLQLENTRNGKANKKNRKGRKKRKKFPW